MSYATPLDLRTVGLPGAFFTGDLSPSPVQQQAMLDNGAALMDSIMAANPAITLPLSPPYDPTLIRTNVAITAWDMLSVRGYDPENPSDKNIKARYDEAMKWLDRLASGRATLQRQVTRPNPLGQQPMMACNSNRGLRNRTGGVGYGGR